MTAVTPSKHDNFVAIRDQFLSSLETVKASRHGPFPRTGEEIITSLFPFVRLLVRAFVVIHFARVHIS
jgi:hypothetical protein